MYTARHNPSSCPKILPVRRPNGAAETLCSLAEQGYGVGGPFWGLLFFQWLGVTRVSAPPPPRHFSAV